MKKVLVLTLTLLLAASQTVAQANKTDPGLGSANAEPASNPAPSTTANALASLPAGTPMRMKLETPISTTANQAGDRFAGRVVEAVLLNGRTVIPVGSSLEGRVVKLSEPRRFAGMPTIDIRPETITLPDGQRYDITATVTDTDRGHMKVNDEGAIKGQGRTGRDNMELAAGSGAGLVAGAVIAGGKGALIGTAAGATITTVHWLTKRHTAQLPAGTEITMELDRPMTITGAAGGR